jgi:sulfite exporter TauE/SafE/copper chaperone CopZ
LNIVVLIIQKLFMSKTFHFAVDGTHCASCEIVIEREVKKLPGVTSVKASSVKNTVVITAEREISAEECTAVVKEHGYRFRHVEKQSVVEAFSWERVILAAAFVFVAWYILTSTGVLNYAPTDATGKGLVAVFGVGLVAAFSSCTAVVSGLLVAISSRSAAHHLSTSFAQKMKPHVAFNVGRLVGFIGFGALVGVLGSVLELSSVMNGVLVLLVALLMIGIGIDLLGVMPAGLSIRPPKWLSHRIHAIAESKNPLAPAVLGAATFFLPCGFTQSMQLYALSIGSPAQAAMIMGVFALGTLPALLGLGALTSSMHGQNLKRMTYAVGVLVVALGLTNVSNAATLLGFSGFTWSSGKTEVSVALIDGKQLVTMEVTAFGYAPNVITVKKGIPVDWQIYGGEQLGCASTLVMRAFNVQTAIRPGENQVAFTPTKTGSYPFSCSMGMVKGTMVVIE